jgi:hypothetical protein
MEPGARSIHDRSITVRIGHRAHRRQIRREQPYMFDRIELIGRYAGGIVEV